MNLAGQEPLPAWHVSPDEPWSKLLVRELHRVLIGILIRGY